MKNRMNLALILALAFAAANAFAGSSAICFTAPIQQGVGKGPISVPRDPELEKQSARNLEVAKFYFYRRKPDKNDKDGWLRLNKAVESRLTEILDSNPTYGRMIEVYFMLGEVYHRMGDLDKASENWNKAVKEDSDEKVKAEAQKRLDESKTKDKK